MKLSLPETSKVTRTAIRFLISFILVVFFCGCPYSSGFKIDAEPQLYIEEAHIGQWVGIVLQGDPPHKTQVKMEISKKTDQEYNIMFTGRFESLNRMGIATKDTIRATGFLSDVDNRKFLNLEIRGLNYLAEFIYDNDKISILPLNEHFTNRIVKSHADIRKSLSLHFKTRLYPSYDDDFCLRNMIKVN